MLSGYIMNRVKSRKFDFTGFKYIEELSDVKHAIGTDRNISVQNVQKYKNKIIKYIQIPCWNFGKKGVQCQQ